TGTEKHSDAGVSVTRRARLHRRDEAVLRQTEPREAVVAAVDLGERRRQRRIIDASDLPDTGIQRHRLEAAGSQAAALCAQALQRGAQSATNSAGGSEAGERERFHASSACSSTLANGVPALMGRVCTRKPQATSNCCQSRSERNLSGRQ